MTLSRRKPARTATQKASRAAAAAKASDTIRIVLADDHAMFRGELRKRLAGEADFEIAGEASTPDETVAICETTLPHVLLLEVAMAGGGGMAVLERLRPLRLPTRILMLTVGMPRAELLRGLQLGAHGVVDKDTSPELLFKSIRRVRAGEFWVGRDMVADLVQALSVIGKTHPLRTSLHAPPRAFALTARELEIVAAVASGYTNRQMAERFSVPEDTINHHLTSIFDKTGVSNRLELALFALHHRLA